MRALLLPTVILLLLIVPTWADNPTTPGHSSFGLRTVTQCDNDPTIVRVSQLMECYRAAAITLAFAKDKDGSVQTCTEIYTKFQASGSSSSTNDIQSQASQMSNSCYFEVAKILRDPSICSKIQSLNPISTGLTGEAVSSQLCNDQVTNMAKLNVANYYSDPTHTNLCVLVFILPMIVMGALRFSGRAI